MNSSRAGYEPVCIFLAKCKVKLKRQYLLYMLDGLKFSKRNLFSQIEFTINIIQLTYCKLNISKYCQAQPKSKFSLAELAIKLDSDTNTTPTLEV